MSDNEKETLHVVARLRVERLTGMGETFDKKQMRFNEIVSCALRFYPACPEGGVEELVASCFPELYGIENSLYVKGRPMWSVLETEYGWMLPMSAE
jgi:hypothetical protein